MRSMTIHPLKRDEGVGVKKQVLVFYIEGGVKNMFKFFLNFFWINNV
jgi:hypothetical protein